MKSTGVKVNTGGGSGSKVYSISMEDVSPK